MSQPLLRVAALVDLPLTATSGGHARGWSKMAHAAANGDFPINLTVFFSGEGPEERLSPHVTIRRLPPVFSTARLKFLPYVPDHTDLAKHHPALAQELATFDVIHTTDAFFAFARTAEKISRKNNIPLVTSFHTDTPAYARVFARRTIEGLFGKGRVGRWITDDLQYPERQEASMNRRLCTHLETCSAVMATRRQDFELAAGIIGKTNVFPLRTPIDPDVFGPHRRDRAQVEDALGIPPDRLVCLFVGRLDEGKNIYTLIEALEVLIRENLPIHLIVAGVGPAEGALKERLAGHVSLAGFVQPDDLGRLYASADLLTAPSEVEVRSLVAVEAMRSGIPALLSEKGGVAKHYGSPEAMIPVGPRASDWADALRTLILDPETRARLGREALLFAEKNVPSWRSFVVDDFVPIWQRVAHRKEKR